MTPRLTDEAIRAALRPGPEVVAPDRFVSVVLAAISAGETASGQRTARPPALRPWTIGRTGYGTSAAGVRWRWMLALVTLLLIVAVTAVLIGSQQSVPREPFTTGVFESTGQIRDASDLQRPAIASLADGRVLVAGGNTDYAMTALLYDPASGTYGEPIPMDAPRWDATATTLQDGRVLVVGGITPETALALASTELFDPATATFTATASMAESRGSHTATILDDGRVLIAGGSLNRESSPGSQSFVAVPIASVELYDPGTDTFATASPMTTDRVGHSATLMSDGTVLIAGGYGIADDGTYAPTTSVEVFDPGTASFSPVGAMATGRAGHSATRLPDGRVLIAGGGTAFDPDGFATTVSPTAEIYDPATESFVPTGSLQTERTRHSATLLPDGRVLVAGGSNSFGPPLTTELFDPATGAFEAGPTATSDHRFAIAPLLPDGRVFLPESWGSEIYDPEGGPESGPTAHLSPTARSTAPADFRPVATTIRSGHTAIRLADGRVLIAGGFGGPDQASLSTAEIFDPRSETFSPTGSMAVARDFAVATLLPDGRMLIAGGDPTEARTAEIYDPSSGTFTRAGPELHRWLEDGRFGSVPGLADGMLMVEQSVEGTETAPSSRVLTLIDAVDGHAIGSTSLCGSDRSFGSPAAMLRDGRILILCGRDGPAQLFDPATRTTESVGIRGDWVTATPLSDGRVMLASRDGQSGAATLVFTGIYDPAEGTLEELPVSASSQPDRGRRIEQSGSMTELEDGTVLVAGGFSGALDSAWHFDPDTGMTEDVGPMLAAREQPSVTALDDGLALIVGGVTQSPDRTDPVPPAAELYDARGSR